MLVRNRPVSSTVQENIKKNDKENMHGTTAFKATLCGVFILAAFILALRLRLPSLSVDIIRNKTVSVAKHLKYLSIDLFPNKTIPVAKQLKYGFEWVNTDAKIAVDLDLEDPNTVLFLELLYYTQSKRLQITCPKAELMGGPQVRGGWDVCIAEPYNLVPPCLVYSIGMSEESQWGFDRTVTNKYGCKDMAYDPTIKKRTQKINELMWFFNIGLSDKNGIVNNYQMKTLETLLKDNKHTETTIDILKIDIECSEWGSFDTILANPRCLSNVKQLMVEFHPCAPRAGQTSQQLLRFWRTLRGIDALGFKLWRVWNNYVCRFQSKRLKNLQYFGCFNAYYINIKYLL